MGGRDRRTGAGGSYHPNTKPPTHSYQRLQQLLHHVLGHDHASRQLVPEGDFLEIKYEDLCAQPVAVLQRLFSFANLKRSIDVENVIHKFGIVNANEQWRDELSSDQIRILDHILADHLRARGYR